MRVLFQLPSRLFSKHALGRQLCTSQQKPSVSQRRFQALEHLSCRSIRSALFGSKPQSSVMQALVGLCHERIDYEQQVLEEDVEDRVMDLMKQIPLSFLGFPEGVEQQVCSPISVACFKKVHFSPAHLVQPQLAVPMMGSSSVSYMHLAERQGHYSIGIFLFRDGASLPLHDHENMSVYSRLLFGKIRMQSFDWVDDSPPQEPRRIGTAECIRSVELNGGDIASLYPHEGNMHTFQAVTPAAVLDVLVPGYTNSRTCRYFQVIDQPVLQDGRYICSLQEADHIAPTVESTPYLGQRPGRPL